MSRTNQTDQTEHSEIKEQEEAFSIGDEFEVARITAPLHPPLSGDFHVALPLEDGSVAVVLGDVVGHGAEAAAHAEALCRAIGGCLLEGLPPDEALGFVNAAAEMSPQFEGFATVFAARIAPRTGEIVYASGGHEPALLAETNNDTVRTLDSTGPPLGVIGAEEAHFASRTERMTGGASLLLYTDGVSDARRGREMLGLDRLRAAFARWRHIRPLALVCRLLGYARAFAGQGRRLRDDAALLTLRRRPAPGRKRPAPSVDSIR